MTYKPQINIPATYMRGGTSKGVFFNLTDLPKAAQVAGEVRDKLLLRVIGSPDPYGKQTDGMGGATSSTSKAVILSKSKEPYNDFTRSLSENRNRNEGKLGLGRFFAFLRRIVALFDDKKRKMAQIQLFCNRFSILEQAPRHDVDYLFGQVAIDRAFVDWSGNCGNLTAAVGSFAISNGLVEASRIPDNGVAVVRIWQANIKKTIIAHVPITAGQVQETGDFELDGVTFPAAEVKIEFVDPVGDAAMFPTGNLIDDLEVPGVGTFKATMIAAGIPTIFLNAADIGFKGTELQGDINGDEKILTMFETIRAHGAIKMGLIQTVEEAASRQHTPKVAFLASPAAYTSSSGKTINADDIDLNVRALSMGLLHHAMMGTAAVAIATAAAIPGTLVNLAAGGGNRHEIRFGHPSGTLKVGAKVSQINDQWKAQKVSMSRSARRLMVGQVFIPE